MKIPISKSLVVFFLFISNLNGLQAATNSESFFNDLEAFKEKSLNLSTQRSSLEAASSSLLAKKLFWTPSLSADVQKGKEVNNGTESVYPTTLGVQMNWNLFQGGKSYHDLMASKAKYREQELSLYNESLQVEVTGADLIFKNIYLQEIVRIAEEVVRLKEESLKIAKDRFAQGKLPHHEMIKAEVDLTQQRSKLRSSKLDLFENKTEFQSFFISTIKTSTWPFSESAEAKQPTTSSPTTFPLLEQKYWSAQSYEAFWNSSKSLHYPSIDFSMEYKKELTQDQNKSLVGLVTLTFPLWNGYESSSQIAQNWAQYQSALNDQKSSEQKINQKYLFLKEKINVARSNLIEAQKNLSLSKGLYKEVSKAFLLGRISINDLFLEQNRLIESENSLSNSQLLFHQSLIEYCAITGIKASVCILNH